MVIKGRAKSQPGWTTTRQRHGQRFDFTAYRPDDIEARLREMKSGGYGISIMRQFMDEVHYNSSDATGNTLRLVKYLKKT